MKLIQDWWQAWQDRKLAKQHNAMAHLHALARSGQTLRVLGVDDNPVNCKVLQAMVEKLGYQFASAASGHQALELVEQGAGFDVIIMDCEMPVMSGFEATKRLRALELKTRQLPIAIIALTGHVLEKDKNNCLKSGMNDFLSKPLQYQQLKQLLQGS